MNYVPIDMDLITYKEQIYSKLAELNLNKRIWTGQVVLDHMFGTETKFQPMKDRITQSGFDVKVEQILLEIFEILSQYYRVCRDHVREHRLTKKEMRMRISQEMRRLQNSLFQYLIYDLAELVGLEEEVKDEMITSALSFDIALSPAQDEKRRYHKLEKLYNSVKVEVKNQLPSLNFSLPDSYRLLYADLEMMETPWEKFQQFEEKRQQSKTNTDTETDQVMFAFQTSKEVADKIEYKIMGIIEKQRGEDLKDIRFWIRLVRGLPREPGLIDTEKFGKKSLMGWVYRELNEFYAYLSDIKLDAVAFINTETIWYQVIIQLVMRANAELSSYLGMFDEFMSRIKTLSDDDNEQLGGFRQSAMIGMDLFFEYLDILAAKEERFQKYALIRS